jgi:hypothetical protein
MAQLPEFKSQQLFTGVKRSEAFQPEKAPDYSTGIEVQAASQVKNLNNLQAKLDADDAVKVNRQVADLEAWSKLGSPTAARIAELTAAAWFDSQVVKAHEDAQTLGRLQNYGITPEEQEQVASLEAENSDTNAVINANAYDLVKKGGTLGQVNFIKSIPSGSWRRYWAEKEYARLKGETTQERWQQYLTANRDTEYTDRFGQKFRLGELSASDPRSTEKLGLVFDSWSQEDLVNIGISQQFNPMKSTMRPYYDSKAGLRNKIVNLQQKQVDFATSQRLREETLTKFKNNLSSPTALAETVQSYIGLTVPDSKGNPTMITDYGQALTAVMADLALLGKMDVKDGGIPLSTLRNLANTQIATYDPKKQTMGKFHKERFWGKEGLMSQLDAINTQRVRALREEDFVNARQGEDVGMNFLTQWRESGGTTEQLKAGLSQLQLAYPQSNFSFIQRVVTQNNSQASDEYWETLFQDMENEGTLTPDVVSRSSASATLKQTYHPISMQQYRANLGKTIPDANVQSTFRSELKAALSATGLPSTKGDTGENLALAMAMRQYRANIALQMKQNKDNPNFRVDQQAAIQGVVTSIKTGSEGFSVVTKDELDPGTTAFGTYFKGFVPRSVNQPLGQFNSQVQVPVPSEENKAQLFTIYQDNPETIKTQKYLSLQQFRDLASDVRNGSPVPRIPALLEQMYSSNPQGYETLEDFVNEQMGLFSQNYKLAPGVKTQLKQQVNDDAVVDLINKARTRTQLDYAARAADPNSLINTELYGNPRVTEALKKTAVSRQTIGKGLIAKPLLESTDSQTVGFDGQFKDGRFPAFYDGTIKDIGQDFRRDAQGNVIGFGHYVVVEHFDEVRGVAYDGIYSHLSAPSGLTLGQRIRAGQIVGLQGSSGRTVPTGTSVASFDVLEAAPRGSKSMTKYRYGKELIQRLMKELGY